MMAQELPIEHDGHFITSSINMERIARRFYAQFKAERALFLASIRGIEHEADRERFASLLLNRLMFVYFMQHKGLLDGDKDYCLKQLYMMQACYGIDTFYQRCLLPLFHQALGRPERSRELDLLLGTVPYLGGRLFMRHEVERRNP